MLVSGWKGIVSSAPELVVSVLIALACAWTSWRRPRRAAEKAKRPKSAPCADVTAADAACARAAAESALQEWKAPDVKKEPEKAKSREASSEMALLRWNQAIDKAAKNQDAETAERLIGKIREAGLSPDIVSYNSVM